MDNLKLVCATDDGINFSKEHFGSAKIYLFYSLNLDYGEIKFLKEIKNITPDEKKHADSKKAKAVSDILSDAQIVINLVFGPNIARIRKKFIPIISKEDNIDKSLEKIKDLSDKIRLALKQTGDKDILYINGVESR
jgi:hypothetical protein